MSKVLSLFGLAPELVKLVRELVAAAKAGDHRAVILKAQRIAEIEAFKVRHGYYDA